MHLASIRLASRSRPRYTRGNHLSFMNENISKEIMKRTRFRNQFLKSRTDENKIGTQNKGTIVFHY